MDIRIKKAAPSDATMLLEYLKQVGGESNNLTFGSVCHFLLKQKQSLFLVWKTP